MANNLLLTGHSVLHPTTQAEVLALAFNQTTTLLASAGVDRSIMLWSQLDNFDNTAVLKGHTNAITALTWTYTDRLLTASADKSVVNWDVEVFQIRRSSRSQSASTAVTSA
jgi:WD40 repeat protein